MRRRESRREASRGSAPAHAEEKRGQEKAAQEEEWGIERDGTGHRVEWELDPEREIEERPHGTIRKRGE